MIDPWYDRDDNLIDLSQLPSPKDRDAALLQRGIDRCDIDPAQVRKQFGTWVVTDYGLECLTDYYNIERARLKENDWEYHMAGKTWVNMQDFLAAYRFATGTSNRKRPAAKPATVGIPDPVRPSMRFAVFKRDNYQCQICGRGPQDGVVLHADYKIARSKGGPTIIENLWTLCSECNFGKGTRDL